ncbi:helix-turn-helix domain-containing protein [Cohnella suwonensis]|uniref:Helix-turn-helix domain-containing protein n=1 Tax=Cohnella suwonensis TaxID=696072 RepID=A0ABW0LRB9_9BACL
MSLGQQIRAHRLKRGLTQGQLADKLSMTEANISSYERDKSMPPSEVLNKLANILGTSTDILLGRKISIEINGASASKVLKELNELNQQLNVEGVMDYDEPEPEIRAIQRAAKNMSPTDKKKMLNMIKAAFEEAFKGESDDKT